MGGGCWKVWWLVSAGPSAHGHHWTAASAADGISIGRLWSVLTEENHEVFAGWCSYQVSLKYCTLLN
jgi:hypothetical protein